MAHFRNSLLILLVILLAIVTTGCITNAYGPNSTDRSSTHGHGAGWVSSGGEIFKPQSRNPWFLQNTKQVTYCVKISEGEISTTPEKINSLITDAFNYWQYQFARVPEEDRKVFQLGTQQFVQAECSASTDLRFLFGYNSLSADELDYIGNPRSFVGLNVRTDYDPVQLKGKGFIFIASDKGPHRYEGENLVDQAWQHDEILRFVLMHELGHIFGLPHLQAGLMAEQTPQHLLEGTAFSANVITAGNVFGDGTTITAPQTTEDQEETVPPFFEPKRKISTCSAKLFDDQKKSASGRSMRVDSFSESFQYGNKHVRYQYREMGKPYELAHTNS